MLFTLGLLVVPAIMAWEIVWTVRHGRLPPLMFLPGVTRRDMPVPFWLFVAGLSFVTALGFATSAAFFVTAFQTRLHA